MSLLTEVGYTGQSHKDTVEEWHQGPEAIGHWPLGKVCWEDGMVRRWCHAACQQGECPHVSKLGIYKSFKS